jgi:predicted nucleic acid-binding protein
LTAEQNTKSRNTKTVLAGKANGPPLSPIVCFLVTACGGGGGIDIFSQYNFTTEENTPQDIEIALDPELLGKVFENLLGTYNEETSSTARNDSGSFYTPREIIEYMVDSSLKEYFKNKLQARESETDQRLDDLFSRSVEPHNFSAKQAVALVEAIYNYKILDPACGSSAFPMGVLNKLVFIAAIVIKNNGTLISNNTKHYEYIEQLNLINWL